MPDEPLPSPGLGTSGNQDEACADAVERALDLGYRHVDTAQAYGNEEAVGAGIARSGVDRDEVFLATKIRHGDLEPDDVREAIDGCLDRLGVDSVDLLYVHWPINAYDAERTLPVFDELRDDGLTQHVGLSNFSPALLDEAREILDAPIFAHQVECHPWFQQDELRAYAREHDHYLVAYSPIMKGRGPEEPVLVDIAEAHDATPHQIALAWLLSLENVVPIPKASGEHVDENWAAREIELSDEERERIEGIDRQERLVDPDRAVWNQ